VGWRFARGENPTKRDVNYKNDEMNNLMQALNVEDNTEGLLSFCG